MRILAIDPGETSGAVLIAHPEWLPTALPHAVGWALISGTFREVVWKLRDISRRGGAEHVVVEDYRMYAGKEAMHTGGRLYTAELIGAIRALAAIRAQPPEVHALQAQAKNRWSDKRLRRYYSRLFEAAKWRKDAITSSPHTLDAFKLGLAWLEKEGGWTPVLPES